MGEEILNTAPEVIEEESTAEEEYVPKAVQYAQTQKGKIDAARQEAKKRNKEMLEQEIKEENSPSGFIGCFFDAILSSRLLHYIVIFIPAFIFFNMTNLIDRSMGFKQRYELPLSHDDKVIFIALGSHVLASVFMGWAISSIVLTIRKHRYSITDGIAAIKGSSIALMITGTLVESALMGAVAWDWGRISAYVTSGLYIVFYILLAISAVVLYASGKSRKPKKLPYMMFVVCVVHFLMNLGTLSINLRDLKLELLEIFGVAGIVVMAVSVMVLGVFVLVYNRMVSGSHIEAE